MGKIKGVIEGLERLVLRTSDWVGELTDFQLIVGTVVLCVSILVVDLFFGIWGVVLYTAGMGIVSLLYALILYLEYKKLSNRDHHGH